ncbi:putative calcium-transporting ATPase 13, plasma membrane-type [Beta vulgaris subsp. vulgaris]|uniref:putative calcium-transporting ATPase 13, plasma membrane-type n=1 Tax=Beta vulgaris subsp. vulgaris TaxID=3555 RepID=UPI00053F7062|nr:putative calcium-transporting ATPase 13, plasma membrane-type [Beta vulgaris subsp. vulgaris]
MSTRLHENLVCIEFLLKVPENLSKPNKRWQRAFASIYCSRALLSLAPNNKHNEGKLPHSYSYSILNLEPHQPSLNVDQQSLSKLTKQKDLQQIQEFGGVDSIAIALKTHLDNGIHDDDQELVNRHEAFGTNTYKKPPSLGLFHFVWEAFKDFTILILLFCAALSLGFGIKQKGPKEGWYDGGSIFVAVFLVIIVSSLSNFKQSKQFEKLSKQSNNIKIEVVRGGRRQQVSIYEIVVGDVVCLKIGDQVPADGLFIDGHSLQIDESSMTGESDHVGIDRAQHPFLVSGTKVADGYGKMLVTSVGMNTTWGEMMGAVSRNTDEQTPLQARLNKLTSSIGKLGLAVAFLVLVVLLVRYFTGHTTDESGNIEFNGSRTSVNNVLNAVVRIVAAAVTIVVVAIPEGLPLAVTLTLAYSMKRMMADQAMVRKLSACETMGSATVICTDKTGTLTQNQMKVTSFWLGQNPVEHSAATEIASGVLACIQEGVGFNTTGSVYKGSSSSDYEFSGSPTEKALLSWAVSELNMDMQKLNQVCTILHVEAFNSQKKRSGVLIKRKEGNNVHVHWKGAAEMILEKCSCYYDASGNLKPMDGDAKKNFEQIIQSMAASSLRCIAFAHKQVALEEGEAMAQEKLTDGDLVLLGMVGLKDPCRPGVKKAVQDCQTAGVNIKMITGDNVFTARAIAVECGILQAGDDIDSAVVEGPEFRNYTELERIEKVDKIRVMARSSPFDKLLMVQCLKQKGHVVAVTGDGTNDAPALKEADIGLSMGIQGTEVAKESSDIVIMDDNFASVATVLNWGRCVYNNIQKFIQFQLTVNVAALTINFVAAVSAGEVPLTAVQLLWVNLIMDTLGALALATEKPTKELMYKAPVGRTEPLITNVMWRNLMAQALYQIAILLTLQFKGESIFGVGSKVKDTLLFNTFVLCQVFNEFNARKLEKKNIFEGIHKNKLFLAIIGITIILQVVMVEFLKKFANTERLNWGQWGACIGIAVVSWPLGWLVKLIPVAEKPFFSYIKWQNSCFWKKNRVGSFTV